MTSKFPQPPEPAPAGVPTGAFNSRPSSLRKAPSIAATRSFSQPSVEARSLAAGRPAKSISFHPLLQRSESRAPLRTGQAGRLKLQTRFRDPRGRPATPGWSDAQPGGIGSRASVAPSAGMLARHRCDPGFNIEASSIYPTRQAENLRIAHLVSNFDKPARPDIVCGPEVPVAAACRQRHKTAGRRTAGAGSLHRSHLALQSIWRSQDGDRQHGGGECDSSRPAHRAI